MDLASWADGPDVAVRAVKTTQVRRIANSLLNMGVTLF
jgi:hypothetical protein